MCSTDYNGHRTGLGVTLSPKSDPVTMFVSSQFQDVLNATDGKPDSVLSPHLACKLTTCSSTLLLVLMLYFVIQPFYIFKVVEGFLMILEATLSQQESK